MTKPKGLRITLGIAVCVLLFLIAPIAVPTACNILRGGDPAREIAVAWKTLSLLGMMAVGGVVIAVVTGIWQFAWKLAERPDSLWKKGIIGAICLAPVALILRSYDLHLDVFLSHLHGWMRYLFATLIGLSAYRATRHSNMPPLRKYLVAYTAIVVLMWLASAGAFHGGDDSDYDDDQRYEAPRGPLLITNAELLLANISVYSAGAFIGIAVGQRVRRGALPRA